MDQITVGIREAKMRFSKYVRLVQQGKEIVITDHGRPVGKIVPLEIKELSFQERVKQLEENGLISQTATKSPLQITSPIEVPDNIAQKFLDEDRRHGY